MPTYYRPRVAHVDPGGADWGGLVLIAAAIGAAAAVVLFAVAHLVLLAAAAAVFVTVMGAVIGYMRWLASPRRFRQHMHPQRATVPAPRPARALPAPRPRAIEAPRAVTEPSPHVNRDRIPRVP